MEEKQTIKKNSSSTEYIKAVKKAIIANEEFVRTVRKIVESLKKS